MKKCRQFLEVASAILGLIAAVMYFFEVRQNLSSDDDVNSDADL